MFQRIKQFFCKEKTSEPKEIKNILAVEDKPKNAQFLSRALLRPGYHLLMAKDRENGFQMAEQYKPSLIILSAMLQGEKTLDLCARLKTSDSTKHIPILTIAEKDDRLNILEYYEQRVDEYLTKPVSVTELFQRIEILIEETAGETNPEI